ncbi:helix-turn-helix transcriptional regulator [Clostridium sp. D53t1_180928_C8]|uniref:helix-turn-helix domain-containing protein n=1 Tax=Clostridium sp. D53t1_180928_C8 TaxID=2787101 RepID=UPI0018AB3846|nr:helix-turn-helix transcriptional regulator [Clostridium sp. D53t1_180928_C8]
MESLGEKLAYLRNREGISQRKLMNLLQFENLHKYEKNQREPSIEILKKLALYFGVTVDWLLDLNDDKLILSSDEIKLIENLRKLPKKEQFKIEGMIELKLLEIKD